jgi:hypothetical protein
MMSCLRSITTDYILNGSSCNMTIMRSSCSEWWSIIKSIGRKVFGLFKLLLEGIDLIPIFENFLLLLGEVDPFRG